jgi:hypothetical protein
MTRNRSGLWLWFTLFGAIATVVLMTAALVPGPWHHHHAHSEDASDHEHECPICTLFHHAVFNLNLPFELKATYIVRFPFQLQPVFRKPRTTVSLSYARAPPRALPL